MGRKGGGIRCCDSSDGEEAVTWYTHAMLVYDFLLSKKERSSLSINHIYMRQNILRIYDVKVISNADDNAVLSVLKETVSSLSTEKEKINSRKMLT
ncbi:MAG: hypothetical protein O9353_08940 [Bacteroidia bacterium]|nr:hypothetical protein [Bacteroidia bacterium]